MPSAIISTYTVTPRSFKYKWHVSNFFLKFHLILISKNVKLVKYTHIDFYSKPDTILMITK